MVVLRAKLDTQSFIHGQDSVPGPVINKGTCILIDKAFTRGRHKYATFSANGVTYEIFVPHFEVETHVSRHFTTKQS